MLHSLLNLFMPAALMARYDDVLAVLTEVRAFAELAGSRGVSTVENGDRNCAFKDATSRGALLQGCM